MSQRTPALIILVGICLSFLWLVHDVMIPVLLGAVFAVPLVPWYEKLIAKYRLNSLIAAALVTMAVLVFIFPPTLMAVLGLMKLQQAVGRDDWLEKGNEFTQTFMVRIESWLEKLHLGDDNIENLRSLTTENLRALGPWSVKFAGHFMASLPQLGLYLFLLMLAMFFFLRDGEALKLYLNKVLPFSTAEIKRLYRMLNDAVRGVLLGSMLTGIVQSIICTLALVLLKVPGAFLWGVLAFFASFVPVVGTMPVTGGAFLYLLIKGRAGAAVVMAISALIIGVSDNIVRPFVQDARSNLHPLLTLVAIFGGLQILGPSGLFLGPVLASMVIWAMENRAT